MKYQVIKINQTSEPLQLLLLTDGTDYYAGLGYYSDELKKLPKYCKHLGSDLNNAMLFMKRAYNIGWGAMTHRDWISWMKFLLGN